MDAFTWRRKKDGPHPRAKERSIIVNAVANIAFSRKELLRNTRNAYISEVQDNNVCAEKILGI